MPHLFRSASFSIGISLLATIAGACSPSQESASPPAADPSAKVIQDTCPQFIASLPQNYVHDWVNVPEEPGNPNSPTLKVFYYHPKTLTGEVTLFLNGGPGGNSHGTHELLDKSLGKFSLTDKVSFVYMDQRGTGCSSDYPDDPRDEKILERARWYGTRGIAADAEAVREKLMGSKPWSVLGQSYGAFIVHRYAVLYPDSLHKALAYANTINADPLKRAKDRIASQFFAWDRYFDQYPGDRARIKLLLTQLTPSTCLTTPDNQHVCGYELISPLVSQSLGFMDTWPKIHKTLSLMVPQDMLQLEKIKKFASATFSSHKHFQNMSLYTINIYDRNVAPLDFDQCTQIAAQIKSDTPTAPEFGSYLTECSVDTQFKRQSVGFKKVKTYFGDRNDHLTVDALKTALEGPARGKFYLYSAEFDPYVPARSFAEELAEVRDLVTYRSFPGTGHEGFFTQNQVLLDLTD